MRNIKRSEVFEPLFKRFTENPHPDTGKPIFSTIRDFLCFLAVLGFSKGERTPLTAKTLELDSRVFENHEQSRDLLYLVALAGSRDANVLQPDREEEMVKIFEEYVASGCTELELWMKQCPDDHVGDQVILTALRREGYFEKHSSSLEKAISEIDF